MVKRLTVQLTDRQLCNFTDDLANVEMINGQIIFADKLLNVTDDLRDFKSITQSDNPSTTWNLLIVKT